MLAYLVWVVGLDERFGEEVATAPIAASGSRASAGDVVLPPLEIDPNAARTAKGFDMAAAEAAAVDVIQDLEIEIRAVKERDPALAMTSSAGARASTRCSRSSTRRAKVAMQRFRPTDSPRCGPSCRAKSPQAEPQLRFDTTATIVLLHADGTLGATTAVEATVVIRVVDGAQGAYLISDAT